MFKGGKTAFSYLSLFISKFPKQTNKQKKLKGDYAYAANLEFFNSRE